VRNLLLGAARRPGRGPARPPDGMRRGAPAAACRPRPQDAGEYLPHQTRLSTGKTPAGAQRRTRREQARGGQPGRVSGQRDDAATRPVVENVFRSKMETVARLLLLFTYHAWLPSKVENGQLREMLIL
jgi:hypothetical protein